LKPDDLTLVVLGTFDSKGEEHLFLKERIEGRGFQAITVNVGTKNPPFFVPNFDLHNDLKAVWEAAPIGRDGAINSMIKMARDLILELFRQGRLSGIISAGGGTGTHICSSVMKALPMGIPKVIVSTVASRDMSSIVGTKDITMMHSVVDLLGINSISGAVLDRAAGAVCAMAQSRWKPAADRKKIALTMFGFITEGAENVRTALEALGYEVIAFHANGTGGMSMEELAREGFFDGILDLATHEFADELKGGYCRGIGPARLKPAPGMEIPRLVVPGGLDCAVLEFTRDNIPEQYRNRRIFFYDFRSAIRLSADETEAIASIMAERLNIEPSRVQVLIPLKGWSEADMEGGTLHEPALTAAFVKALQAMLNPDVKITEVNSHINEPSFAEAAALIMDAMVGSSGRREHRP